MIVTIASQKGGVGKSTVSMNLALGVAGLSASYKVALIDADQQLSCLETLQNYKRANLSLYEGTKKPHRLVKSIVHKYKALFIDTPPHSHEIMYQAAAVSRLVIIPLQPSPLDIRGVGKTVQALKVIRDKVNPKLECRFLVNRVKPRTILANDFKVALNKHYSFPAFETMMHDREAYKQSLITGKSVLEFKKKSPAAEEMGKILIEVATVLRMKKMLRN
ncbi:ParA family protein [Desulfopila sp. IMCC35008]|uniref:ParA family protein n=1 Tax=Desulfopila sp. IMCC35008 TaxID=2653858 RepID=UPI0013D21246|nr:ParA family protein [Desulfopila sp. IMCC35008]